jgi:hypothetical protein
VLPISCVAGWAASRTGQWQFQPTTLKSKVHGAKFVLLQLIFAQSCFCSSFELVKYGSEGNQDHIHYLRCGRILSWIGPFNSKGCPFQRVCLLCVRNSTSDTRRRKGVSIHTLIPPSSHTCYEDTDLNIS